MLEEHKILNALRQNPKPSIRGIAQITGIPKSTVHDILVGIMQRFTILQTTHVSPCTWIVCWGAATSHQIETLQKIPYLNRLHKMYGNWFMYQMVFPDNPTMKRLVKHHRLDILFYGVEEYKFEEASLL